MKAYQYLELQKELNHFFSTGQWTAEEAEVLTKRQKEYNDMHLITRAEAEAALRKLGVPRDLGGNYHILDVLEGLKLIKFKEPEPVNVNRERFRLAMRKLGYCEGSKGYHDAIEAYDSIYT